MHAKTAALALGLSLIAPAALAQDANANRLGTFKDWSVFSAPAPTGKGKLCFLMAQPKSTEPKTAKRDPVHLWVTARPADGVKGEVSVMNGYTFKEGSTAVVQVGNDKFELFTKNDGAWLAKTADDARLVEAMRKGSNLVVKGTSKRGTDTTDTYSLAGFAAALERMAQECK